MGERLHTTPAAPKGLGGPEAFSAGAVPFNAKDAFGASPVAAAAAAATPDQLGPSGSITATPATPSMPKDVFGLSPVMDFGLGGGINAVPAPVAPAPVPMPSAASIAETAAAAAAAAGASSSAAAAPAFKSQTSITRDDEALVSDPPLLARPPAPPPEC